MENTADVLSHAAEDDLDMSTSRLHAAIKSNTSCRLVLFKDLMLHQVRAPDRCTDMSDMFFEPRTFFGGAPLTQTTIREPNESSGFHSQTRARDVHWVVSLTLEGTPTLAAALPWSEACSQCYDFAGMKESYLFRH